MNRLLTFLSVASLAVACTVPVVSRPDPDHTEARTMRPTTFPDWATNATYAGGPDVGTPTKIAPAPGRVQDGWRNTDVPPAQEENYEKNLLGQWVQWFDNGIVSYANVAAYAQSQVDGTRIYVPEMGWYQFHTAPPFTADGFWAINGVGGQWVHQSLAFVHLGKSPAIGPTPGDALATVTPAGRINKQYIDHGYFTHDTGGPTTYSSSAVALATFGVITNLGTLAIGDIVTFSGSAIATCLDAFQVGPFMSADGGSTWRSMLDPAAGNALPHYAATGGGRNIAIAMTFAGGVWAAGDVQIALRGWVDSNTACSVTVSSWVAQVNRP